MAIQSPVGVTATEPTTTQTEMPLIVLSSEQQSLTQSSPISSASSGTEELVLSSPKSEDLSASLITHSDLLRHVRLKTVSFGFPKSIDVNILHTVFS
jgi:hypothetical protein